LLTTVYIATQLDQIIGRELFRTFIVLLLVGIWPTSRARADDDFAVQNRSWNGLSDFLSLVVESGVKAELVERIDMGSLSVDDALLIIHPTNELPIHASARFMKRGGRLAVLDDFGASYGFLYAFEFGRSAPVVRRNTRRLRNNDNLLVARPTARHPLAEKVSALVTNHPQTLYHSELKPIFAFDTSRSSALILVGAVGEGRLIAISDSSLLINNMLEFPGNRVFARNLIRYLTKDNLGRLFIAIGDATLIDSHIRFAPRDSLDGIRQALILLSRHRLSPLAVHTLTGIVLTLLLLIAATALARESPYISFAALIKQQEVLAGFWGSVRFFSQRGRNLLNPLLVFRFELLEAIRNRIGSEHMRTPSDFEERLREINIPESEIEKLQRLLRELDALHSQCELSAHPRIGRRKFRHLVAKGTHMLNRLEKTTNDHETRR